MLGKLQRKFVAMIMAVVVLALVAMFASIAAITVQQTSQQLADDLSVSIDIASDERRSPEGSAREAQPAQNQPPSESATGAPSGEPFQPPQIGRAHEERIQTPVAVYVVEGNGMRLASRSGASLDADVLADVVVQCVDASDGEGALPSQGLVFLKRNVAGTAYVAFASDAATDALNDVLLLSLGVGLPALLFFLVVAVAFSRWATMPVQTAWDQQREFVTNASHELKTPLSVIKADTEVLLDEPDCPSSERMRWLASTKAATESLEALVDDLIALASLDEGVGPATSLEASTNQESFDASRVVEGCVLKFESRAIEGGFSLESEVEDGLCSNVGSQRLGRLADLLLDNACKYVDKGGTVSVSFFRVNDGKGGRTARFVVANTGPTIPSEKLGRVFDRFYRVDEARDTNKGHGLGLSLAKALSDQMDAGISAESADGMTAFSFSVPLSDPGR